MSSFSISSTEATRIGRFAPPRRARSGSAFSAARDAAAIGDERPKGSRADILRAYEPQPIEALLVGKAQLRLVRHPL